MKQIIFKKLYIKNFLSVGNIPVEICFSKGLNIITGINLDKEDSANGVGKSTIADALYFSLFGESLRELNKDQIINNINKKECKIMVSLDVIDNSTSNEYTIVRGIQPTILQLFKDGEDITQSSIPKTTEHITKLLCVSPDVFKNSVIMSVNNTLPFMAQKKVERRKFVEGILSLGVFGDMLLAARQKFNDTKKDIDIDTAKNEEIQKTLSVYIEQQKKQTQQKEDRLKVLLSRQESNTKEIAELTPKIINVNTDEIAEHKNNINLLKQKEQTCKQEEKEVNNQINVLTAKLMNNNTKISDITNKGHECYACKRPFEINDMQKFEVEKQELINENNTINDNIKELSDKILKLESTQDKCKSAVEKINKKIRELEDLMVSNSNYQARLEQLNKWQSQLVIDINELNSQHNEFNISIDETKERYDVVTQSLKSLKDRLSILDTVKFIVSEEGVKSFIVKKILKLLNGRLDYYLKKLDANCSCTFNEYFEENIINDKKQECSYHNFSGGERKRIDLAMLFTFMDMRRLQSNIFINVSFYDEIFDSSLDEKGIKLFLDILNDRIDKYNESINIISHNKVAINALTPTSNIIYLKKENGFTTLDKKGI